MAAPHKPVPIRRGIAKTLTLDPNAVAILRLLTPSFTGQGQFVSDLLRQEMTRREERQKVLDEVAARDGWG